MERLYWEGVDLYRKKEYEKAFKCFYEVAMAGHREAEYYLGVCYGSGKGVPQDIDLSIAWYEKAAKHKSAEALNNLGVLYRLGEIVEKDEEKGQRYLEEASRLGSYVATYNLVEFNEDGTLKDPEKAEELRALAYSQRCEVKKREREIRDFYGIHPYDIHPYLENCEEDDMERLFWKGRDLYEKEKYELALEYFHEAAAAGHEEAEYYIGTCYLNGFGVPQNLDLANEWLEKAAEHKSVSALQYWGGVYLRVHKDIEKALRYLEEAARRGSSEASESLAYIYEVGYCVPQNSKKALAFSKLAGIQSGYDYATSQLKREFYARD